MLPFRASDSERYGRQAVESFFSNRPKGYRGITQGEHGVPVKNPIGIRGTPSSSLQGLPPPIRTRAQSPGVSLPESWLFFLFSGK